MDPQEKEARRVIAAGLFAEDELRDSQIAALLEVTTRAVSKRHKAFREGWKRCAAAGRRGCWTPGSACSCGRCCGGMPRLTGSPSATGPGDPGY
jgi:hypothetical protein